MLATVTFLRDQVYRSHGASIAQSPDVEYLEAVYKLFLALDGVLANFDAGVRALTGKDPEHLPPYVMWPRLARTDGFYEHLDWMPDGRALWDALKTFEPVILTGLPRGAWAEPQKRAWCARELGADVQVITCMTRDKHREARSVTPEGVTPVLVDDRDRIRSDWESMGGVFVLHRSASRSLEDLASVYPELRHD
jgi:hypothetical protein